MSETSMFVLFLLALVVVPAAIVLIANRALRNEREEQSNHPDAPPWLRNGEEERGPYGKDEQ